MDSSASGRARSKTVGVTSFNRAAFLNGMDDGRARNDAAFNRGRSESVSVGNNNRGRSGSMSSNITRSNSSSSISEEEEEMMRMASSALADVASFKVDKLDFNLPPILQMHASASISPTSTIGSSRTVDPDQHAYQVDELLRIRFQMEELKQRKESLEEDVQKWTVVHKAISNLYLEVSDKILDDATREEEKSNLENVDIVVIVDYIRTELRGLMGIKAEFEKEIVIELEKKQAEYDRLLEAEHKKLAEMTKANEELQQKLDKANAQLKEINSAKEQDLREASQHQKQIEDELLATKELIQQKDTGMEEKQTQLNKLHQLIKTKDSKLTKLSEMEARIQQLTSLQDSERQQHQIEVQKLKDKCTALNERATYTAEAKKKLEDELKGISEKMIDIKKHNYFNDYNEVARRFERLTQTSETQTTQLRRTEDELKKTKQLNEELYAKIKELERECGRSQFSAPAKKKEKTQAISEEQYRKVINESPHYVDAYKNLLREKEAQIKDLTTKLRTLLVQANVSVKKPASNGTRKQATTASEPPPLTSDSPPPLPATSSPEQWVSKQMDIMHKATTYAPSKNRDPAGTNTNDDSDGCEEEENDNGGTREKEKWMQGLKTPNMRTIKILKSPSEKELSVISRNPLFNNAADLSRQYMKPPTRKSGMPGS